MSNPSRAAMEAQRLIFGGDAPVDTPSSNWMAEMIDHALTPERERWERLRRAARTIDPWLDTEAHGVWVSVPRADLIELRSALAALWAPRRAR